MKKLYVKSFILLLILVMSSITGCGSSKKGYNTDQSTVVSDSSQGMTEESMPETTIEAEHSYQSSESKAVEDNSGGEESKDNVATNRKLIKKVAMDVQTKDFDQLMKSLTTKISDLNGYIENSDISGNSYDNVYNTRDAHLVIRIPSKKLDEFVTIVDDLGNVVSTSYSNEDITLAYVDVESHKKALQVEHERLLEILKDGKKLEDIIQIEQRLSEVRYEIESYESTLRTFDNLVDYSTVTLSINEVRHIKQVETETVLDRMKAGLTNTLYEMKIDFQDFAVWFVINFPHLLIWTIIISAIVVFIRKRLKRIQPINRNYTSNTTRVPFAPNTLRTPSKPDTPNAPNASAASSIKDNFEKVDKNNKDK